MNSELQITLDEVLPKLPQSLQRKLLHGVDLLRKAEKQWYAEKFQQQDLFDKH